MAMVIGWETVVVVGDRFIRDFKVADPRSSIDTWGLKHLKPTIALAPIALLFPNVWSKKPARRHLLSVAAWTIVKLHLIIAPVHEQYM